VQVPEEQEVWLADDVENVPPVMNPERWPPDVAPTKVKRQLDVMVIECAEPSPAIVLGDGEHPIIVNVCAGAPPSFAVSLSGWMTVPETVTVTRSVGDLTLTGEKALSVTW
jgi:hypothetical protein